jgi:hypothetical protein
MTNHNDLRADQALFNHGPGAVLETTNGPAVVRHYENLWRGQLRENHNFPENFRFVEPRLEAQLHPEARLFELPSNQSLGNERYIVTTRPFPMWAICRVGHPAVLHNNPACPVCRDETTSQPVRFVSYCSDGHLSDVDWVFAVHGPNHTCTNRDFNWHVASSSLNGISVECRACGGRKTMQEISQSARRCQGLHFHEGDGARQECERQPKVTLRGSTVLWHGEHREVISIPADDLEKIVRHLFGRNLDDKDDLDDLQIQGSQNHTLNKLQRFDHPVHTGLGRGSDYINCAQYNHLRPSQQAKHALVRLTNIVDSDMERFESVYTRLLDGGDLPPAIESVRAEFRGLSQAMDPNTPTVEPAPPSTAWFRMDPCETVALGDELELSIAPLPTLQAVMALQGFTRGPQEDAPKLVPLEVEDEEGVWYAAKASFGEGLFFRLAEGVTLPSSGEQWSAWAEAHQGAVTRAMGEGVAMRHLHRAASDVAAEDRAQTEEALAELHPTFVWWHTFAHHLIRIIQAETGYSSTAIRERIYTLRRPDGTWDGGVLLYVTEGGMDGTLGGLTSLLPHLGSYFDKLLETAEVCSNDPLCEETVGSQGHVAPSCYACTMNPETSCAHRNMYLDRLLLLEQV